MKKTVFRTCTAMLCAISLASSGLSLAGDESRFGGFNIFGVEHDMDSPSETILEGDLIALDNQGISIVANGYAMVEEDDGFVYVHTVEDQNIPYVIIGFYEMEAEGITDAFTDYMESVYPDLLVEEPASHVRIGGKDFQKILYSYSIQGGYTVQDTRLFAAQGSRTYMFGSKEVPSLGAYYMLDEDYLEQIASSFAPLAGGAEDYEFHVDDATPQITTSSAELTAAPDTGSSLTSVSPGTPGSQDTESSILFTESIAPYSGTWVPFDDGFRLYIPSDWTWYPSSDEQAAAGILYVAGDPSGVPGAPYINVRYAESYGLTTLDELAADLQASGFTVEEKIDLNGIPCVYYSSDLQDVSGVMFFHPSTSDYVFTVVAAEFTSNVNVLSAVLCSLTPDR